ncbi:MAG: M28 family metallopeptidase [Candidatus Hodarchaeota archaeon]
MVTENYKEIEAESTRTLMKNMRDLSFPRLVGSEGEPKALDMIKAKYKELGYEPIVEKVPTSYYRSNFLPAFGNLLGGSLLSVSTLIYMLLPWLFILPIIIMLGELIMMSSGSPAFSQPPNHPKRWKIFESENLIAQSQGEGDINIVFMGHWDSKSTRLTGLQRGICYFTLLACSLAVMVVGLIGLILYYAPTIDVNSAILTILWICSINGVVPAVILSFNFVGNLSPGACDNATSVANVLECMKFFKENPIEGVKFTYLLTTAEETGLTGSYYFVKNRKDDPRWSPDNTFAINWDLAGLSGPIFVNTAIGIPKKQKAQTLAPLIPLIEEEQDIDVHDVYLPIGGWTDSLSFIHYGYESLTIGSGGAASKVHTINDTPDIINPQRLFASLIVGIELAKKLIASKGK